MKMLYDPATGGPIGAQDDAENYREKYPDVAWRFNPWTGLSRANGFIAMDPRGLSVRPPRNEIPPPESKLLMVRIHAQPGEPRAEMVQALTVLMDYFSETSEDDRQTVAAWFSQRYGVRS